MERRRAWRARYAEDFAAVAVLVAPGLLFALYQGTAIENTLGEIDLFGLGFAAGACLGIPIGTVLSRFLPYRGVLFGTIVGLAFALGAGLVQLNGDVPDASRASRVTTVLEKRAYRWPSLRRPRAKNSYAVRRSRKFAWRCIFVDWEGGRERLRISRESWAEVDAGRDRIELTTYAGRLGWTVVEELRVAR
jgi:hypothetical protein